MDRKFINYTQYCAIKHLCKYMTLKNKFEKVATTKSSTLINYITIKKVFQLV